MFLLQDLKDLRDAANAQEYQVRGGERGEEKKAMCEGKESMCWMGMNEVEGMSERRRLACP
eukprot:764690-Hanusia_phi.AAC.1